MNDVVLSVHEVQATRQARQDAKAWLFGFEAALRARDVSRINTLFHDECYWRDVLAFD